MINKCLVFVKFLSTVDLPRHEVPEQTPLQEWYLWAVQASRPLLTIFQPTFHPTGRRVTSANK